VIPELRTAEDVPALGLCTGCGTCAGVCPRSSITMVRDGNGLLVPQVDEHLCNECRLCLRVCPGIEVDFECLNDYVFGCQPENSLTGVLRSAWAGYSTDESLRFQASSGGVVTELCAFALDEGLVDGVIVTVASEHAPLRPTATVATSRDELVKASGSKYCPVSLDSALREIGMRGGRFAAVGLPCHIHGWRKAALEDERIRGQIVFAFGLACGRVCSFSATEYYLQRKGIALENVHRMHYRGEGWPGKITVVLKDGRREVFPRRYSVRQFYQAVQHNASFGFQHFRPWRCLTCCDRAAELADVSFSDPYLPRFLLEDHIGHTLIVARSRHGEELVKEASRAGRLMLAKMDIQDVIESHQGQLKARKSLPAMFRAASLAGKDLPQYNWATEVTESPSVAYSLSCLASIVERWMGQRRRAWPLIMPWALIRTVFRYLGKSLARMLDLLSADNRGG
jgi:coenzyme F420 hydrogenase subunit beta